jgi:hypothetical protein
MWMPRKLVLEHGLGLWGPGIMAAGCAKEGKQRAFAQWNKKVRMVNNS